MVYNRKTIFSIPHFPAITYWIIRYGCFYYIATLDWWISNVNVIIISHVVFFFIFDFTQSFWPQKVSLDSKLASVIQGIALSMLFQFTTIGFWKWRSAGESLMESQRCFFFLFPFFLFDLHKDKLQEWTGHSHWFSENLKLVEISKNDFNTTSTSSKVVLNFKIRRVWL